MKFIFLLALVIGIFGCRTQGRTIPVENVDTCKIDGYRAEAACTLNIEWNEDQQRINPASYSDCSMVGNQSHVLKVAGDDVVIKNGLEYARVFECTFDLKQSKMLNYSVRLLR